MSKKHSKKKTQRWKHMKNPELSGSELNGTSLNPNGPRTSRLRCRLLLGGPHGDNSIDPKRPVALCLHGIGAVVLLGWDGLGVCETYRVGILSWLSWEEFVQEFVPYF